MLIKFISKETNLTPHSVISNYTIKKINCLNFCNGDFHKSLKVEKTLYAILLNLREFIITDLKLKCVEKLVNVFPLFIRALIRFCIFCHKKKICE